MATTLTPVMEKSCKDLQGLLVKTRRAIKKPILMELMEAGGKGLKLCIGRNISLACGNVVIERVPEELFELAEENDESANWLLLTTY